MPQNPSELIRELYDAFARADVAFVMGHFLPDVVWNEAENFVYADRNPYVGPQAVLEGVFFRLGSEWAGFSVTAEEITGFGDTVLAQGRYRGTNNATGCPINAQFAHVWTLAGDKVARFQQYTDTAQFQAAMTAPRSVGA